MQERCRKALPERVLGRYASGKENVRQDGHCAKELDKSLLKKLWKGSFRENLVKRQIAKSLSEFTLEKLWDKHYTNVVKNTKKSASR